MISQPVVHLGPVMRRLHRGSRPVRESHPGALTAKSRIWKTCARTTQPSSAKGIAISPREGSHLSIGIEILVGPERATLRLAMRREAGLGERPTAESS